MLTFLNRKINQGKIFLQRLILRPGGPLSQKGQVAVILILVVAVALIFYAIALNLGRVAQIKTITTTASNLSAAQMASFMASYGEKIFQEQLGGKEKKCGWTGVFSAILIIVVIIIAIIITIVTWGSGAGAAWAMVAGAYAATAAVVVFAIALAAAIASLALQVAVIQPGLTKLWNKMQGDGLGPTDLIIERGVQTGLSVAVTDPVMVPDFWDMDMDGKYGDLEDKEQFLSRFGYYNTVRLRSIRKADMIAIAKYQKELGDFLYTNGWCESDIDLSPFTNVTCQRDSTNADEFNSAECHYVAASGTLPAALQSKPQACHRDFGLLDKSMTLTGDFDGSGLNSSHPCAGAHPPAECDPCCLPKYAPNENDPSAPACEQSYFPEKAECVLNAAHTDCEWTDPALNASNKDACYRKPLRPASCPGTEVTILTSCNQRSIFSSAATVQEFPFVYDPYYENSLNNDPDNATFGDKAKLSFRELLGRDDENFKYTVNSAKPNWHWDISPVIPPPDAKQLLIPNSTEAANGFYNHDITNYWKPADEQRGIYPFFYKIHDWGVQTSLPPATPSSAALDYKKYQCQWCTLATAASCDVNCSKYIGPLGLSAANITIARDTSLPVPSYSGSQTQLDNKNYPSSGTPPGGPQRLDRLLFSPAIASLFTAEDSADVNGQCASGPVTGTTFMGWKRGSDRYCAQQTLPSKRVYPYHVGCPKQGGVIPKCLRDESGACTGTAANEDPLDYYQCGEPTTSPKDWQDDWLDEITYGIPEFLAYAENFISQRPGILAKTFKEWYLEMADWIEPPCCVKAGVCSPEIYAESQALGGCAGSFTRKTREGSLYEWLREMKNFYDPINNWLSASYVSSSCSTPSGTDPNAVWCVPPAQTTANAQYGINECPWVTGTISAGKTAADHDYSAGEAQTFDSNKNGVRGDIEDVLACMNWNLNDVDPDTGAKGNYEKFKKCADACTTDPATAADACTDLPRSLVPGLTKFVAGSGSPAQLAALDTCIGEIDRVKGLIAANGDTALGFDIAATINSIDAVCDPHGALAGVVEDVATGMPDLKIHWNTAFGGYDPIARFVLKTTDLPNPPDQPLTYIRAFSFQQPLRIRLQEFFGTTIAKDAPTPSTDPLFNDLHFNRQDKMTGWTIASCSIPSPDLMGPCLPPGCLVGAIRCPVTEAMMSCPGTAGYNSADVLSCACSFQLRTFSGLLCKNVGSTIPFKQGNTYNCVIGESATDPGPTDVCPCPAVTGGIFGPNYNVPCTQSLPTVTATCSSAVPQVSPIPYCSQPRILSQIYNNTPATDLTSSIDPNAKTWASFEAAVRLARTKAQAVTIGSCSNPVWLDKVKQSAADAKIQMDKMKKRYEFLQGLHADAQNTAKTLKYGIDYFTKFLYNGTPFSNVDSPAERLIEARKKLKDEPGTASTAIYVWQDPDPKPPRKNPDGTDVEGYWHAVKVEVRIPDRCNERCGLNNDRPEEGAVDPEWPHIKTYTKSWGMKRCYALDGTDGIVKARVIRFDENHDTGQLKFPGGQPIWTFRTQHPDADNPDANINVLSSCESVKIDRDPQGVLVPMVDDKILAADGGEGSNSIHGWRNAFMINRPPKRSDQMSSTASPDEKLNEQLLQECWDAVHEQMIKKGVATDTCAAYYFDGSAPKGFRMKFIKCDESFLKGFN